MKPLQRPASWQAYLLALSASVLLTFLALFAGVFAMVDGFSLTVDVSALVGLCLLSALLSALLYSVPRQSLCVGLLFVALGLLALYTWWRWDAFSAGAQVLFHQVSFGFHTEIPSVLYYELPRALSRSYQRQCVTVFFSAAVPLLALWVCPWLTLGWPVWPAVGAVAGLVITPLLILHQPAPLTLAALLLFFALVILSRRGYRENATTGARRVFGALIPVALVMTLLGALIPDSANPRPLWLEDLRLNLQALPNLSFAVGVGGENRSAPGEQTFASAGPLRFDGHTVLQINSSASQSPLFLRGFSAGQYTARGWEPLDTDADPYPISYQESGGKSPFTYPYQSQPIPTYNIRITDMASHTGYYYLPYYPAALPQDAVFVRDDYLTRPDGVDEYTLSFLPQNRAVPGAAQLEYGSAAYYAEQEYRSWVARNYLDVPYDLLSAEATQMIDDFAAAHAPSAPDSYPQLLELSRQLADYLASFTEYDQSTPVTPPGRDFVSHFLTTSHRGYCLHYASAATLFFRSCGVPARYAEGYVARPGRRSAVTNVPDRNAHAWVELYLDGFGWFPVDVTPGFSGGGSLDDPNATDDDPTPSPSPSPSSAHTTPTPTPTPASVAPSPTPRPSLSHTLPAPVTHLLYVLLTLLGVIAVLGLIYLQYRLRLTRLCKKCAVSDPNQAVLALYRYLTKLSHRVKSIKVPQTAAELAQKAYFSQHVITDDELSIMRSLARTAADTARIQPLPRRLILQYFRALF